MEKRYKTEVFMPIKMTLCFLVFYGLFIPLVFFVSLKLDLVFILIIGLAIVLILPAFYVKKIRAQFMRKVDVIFTLEGFHITFYSKAGEVPLKKELFKWADINSFKMYFTDSGYTNIDLYLKGRKIVKEITFKDKDENLAKKEISIYNLFLSYCYKYNSLNDTENSIKLREGFLTTRSGLICLWILGIANILVIIFVFFVKPGNFGFSIISISFLIPLILKRSADKSLYEKMSKYSINEHLFEKK